MSMKSILAHLFGFAVMQEAFNTQPMQDNRPVPPRPQIERSHKSAKPIPKGCQQYWFSHTGECRPDGMRYTDIAFKCIAISEKSARAKYNKWKEGRHD